MNENYVCHICGGSFTAGLGLNGHSHAQYIEPCQHDFYVEQGNTSETNAMTIKWRCRKCLKIRYTND